MEFLFNHEVDSANKLLICEATSRVSKVLDVEHMLKLIVKLAGKAQVKNVVLDVTELAIGYSSMQMAELMITMQQESWLSDIKIARIIDPKDNPQHLVGEMAEKYNLPIKNFEHRSDALIWLLFNK